MRKIVIIALSFIYIQIGYAQSEIEDIESIVSNQLAKAERKQVKGENNIYNVEKIDSSLLVWNINSVYMDIAPGYPTGFMDEIILLNKHELYDSLKARFFSKIKKASLNKRICLRICIVSDMKGKVEEVYFSYDEDMNISIVDLENLENEIKNKYRLSYRSMDSSPIQAKYLDFVYHVCDE